MNLTKTIISPIIIKGIIINIAAKIFDCIILDGFIGKLFNILNDLPSNEIIELVIDVIKLQQLINANNTIGIYSFI